MHRRTPRREEAEATVKHSLYNLLSLIPTSVHQPNHDDAMVQIGMSEDEFVDPLSRPEVQILACALWLEKHEKPLDYNEVVSLTARFSSRPMNVATLYKTIERLIGREMLRADASEENDGRMRRYKITQHGKAAFRMAVLNAGLLRTHGRSAA
jgi:DNA-binding PadR family transcriptional regulator